MRKSGLYTSAGIGAAAAFLVAAAGFLLPETAEAVVYCKTVGIPKGCVVRPVAPAVAYCTRPGFPVGCVARPAAAAVHCTRPGYPVGCVGGAARVGVPGVPGNRGGPVNRVGIR